MVEDRLERDAERVGQYLLPHPRLAAAAAHPRALLEQDAALAEDLRVLPEAVGDPLQDRPVEVAPGVAEVQSEERAAQVRVVQRRLLAEEVRQADQLGRRRRGGLGLELGDRRAAAG